MSLCLMSLCLMARLARPASSLPPQVASQMCCVLCGARGHLPAGRNGSSVSRASLCQLSRMTSPQEHGRGEGGRDREGKEGGGGSFRRGFSLHLGARRYSRLCNSWDGSLRPPTELEK